MEISSPHRCSCVGREIEEYTDARTFCSNLHKTVIAATAISVDMRASERNSSSGEEYGNRKKSDHC